MLQNHQFLDDRRKATLITVATYSIIRFMIHREATAEVAPLPVPSDASLRSEFAALYQSPEREVVPETDAVVVMSAYEFNGKPSEFDPEDPINAENIARISTAVHITRAVVSARLHKPVEKLTIDELEDMPSLVLNGTTTQLPFMETVAANLGVPADKLISLDCGPKGVANTKTQFQGVSHYANQLKIEGLADPRHITFVTSTYHVPRTRRTGNVHLNPDIDFIVTHTPPQAVETGKIAGEIARIGKYAVKGDITLEADGPRGHHAQ
jgi:uncharacterized SAM-binding protein YcdF (DUF218 family)